MYNRFSASTSVIAYVMYGNDAGRLTTLYHVMCH